MKNSKRKNVARNTYVNRKAVSQNKGIEVVKTYNTKWLSIFSYCTFGILGLIVFFIKRNNDYLRFNGLQAAIMNIPVIFLVYFMKTYLPASIQILSVFVFFVLVAFDLIAIARCNKRLVYKMLYIGDFAEKIVLRK